MKIEVITVWYNEEKLAPYFLNHYKDCEITILLDADTNDKTKNIISYSNSQWDVFSVRFEDGLDELWKISYINEFYKESTADYVIVADADEFVFFDKLKFKRDVYYCRLAQVMKQKNEIDIFHTKHLFPHIDNWSYGFYEKLYCKPSIVKTGLDLKFTVGHHGIEINGKRITKRPSCKGAHWNMITPEFYFNRILNQRVPRQSKANIKRKHDNQYNDRTLKNLRAEYAENLKKCKQLW